MVVVGLKSVGFEACQVCGRHVGRRVWKSAKAIKNKFLAACKRLMVQTAGDSFMAFQWEAETTSTCLNPRKHRVLTIAGKHDALTKRKIDNSVLK